MATESQRKESGTARKEFLSPAKDLISATRSGGVTLVLGAGVSIPRKIPSWQTLAQRVWRNYFGIQPSPWDKTSGGEPAEALAQLLPIVFELAYRSHGESTFIEVLRNHLYKGADLPKNNRQFRRSRESLAVLARLLIAEHKRGAGRRVSSVITFNADDLIEQAVDCLLGDGLHYEKPLVVRPVARSTHSFLGKTSLPVIPIYHVHGFLPSDRSKARLSHYERMLVFTDAQYWSTSASAHSFANRIVNSALSEGLCVFIGLSMTDINLLRWLGLRALDRDADRADVYKHLPKATEDSPWPRLVETQFNRHFWIRPAGDDPSGLLARFLLHRGVRSIEISGWDDGSLARLLSRCFPPDKKRERRVRKR